jgi:hypothetical protein
MRNILLVTLLAILGVTPITASTAMQMDSSTYSCAFYSGSSSRLTIGSGPTYPFVYDDKQVRIEGHMSRIQYKNADLTRYTWAGGTQNLVLTIGEFGASKLYSSATKSEVSCSRL